MEVLENESLGSIISWLPHGLAFAILDKRKFARDVMGKYFKQSKFTSFTRKLNRWGFERVAKGPEAGAYYNALFQRSNLQLCLRMMCQKNRDNPKDGSVASGTGDADGSTASSSQQPKPPTEETRRAQSQKLVNQRISEREQQTAAAAVSNARQLQVEARSNGQASTSQEANLMQLERVRQMLQMQLSASQGAIDGHTQAASAQRLMEASAVSAAHEARLQQHQQQQHQQHQQQQQLQLEDFRQRLEQAQADQASWGGLDQQNGEATMRHLQLLQQQRLVANQGAAAEAAALRAHYGLSEADVSTLQLQHQLSSMRQDQGRAQMEQLEEARQRHMWRQQMEMAVQQQAQLWGMPQSMTQQAPPSQGGSQDGAQRQLQESLAAQSYLQQQQQQQQQQQLLNSHSQQQHQQLDPLTLQLIQQAMNGQFDPASAPRSRYQ
jgi:hypothetical protein